MSERERKGPARQLSDDDMVAARHLRPPGLHSSHHNIEREREREREREKRQ